MIKIDITESYVYANNMCCQITLMFETRYMYSKRDIYVFEDIDIDIHIIEYNIVSPCTYNVFVHAFKVDLAIGKLITKFSFYRFSIGAS